MEPSRSPALLKKNPQLIVQLQLKTINYSFSCLCLSKLMVLLSWHLLVSCAVVLRFFHGSFYNKYVKLPEWSPFFLAFFSQILFFSPKADNKHKKTDVLNVLSLFSHSKIQKVWNSIRLWILFFFMLFFSYTFPSDKSFSPCQLYTCIWIF